MFRASATRAGRMVALVTAALMFLSACASTSGGPGAEDHSPASTADGTPMTADEAQMRAEADTFNTTVAQGSLLGAGLGILAGVLIGATTGRVENMVKYGVVGGVAGGVAGGVDGYMVAKQQEAGNNHVRMIQSMTRDVQADNVKLQALVASSSRILDDSKQRLDDIDQQVSAKTASVADARAAKARVEQNRDVMQSSLATLKKRRDNYAQASAKMGGDDTAQLDQQIARLNQQIAQLEQNVAGMNEVLSVSKV